MIYPHVKLCLNGNTEELIILSQDQRFNIIVPTDRVDFAFIGSYYVFYNRGDRKNLLHTFIADSLNRMDTVYAHFQYKPYRSYILEEYTRFTTMEEVVIEFIPILRFRTINNRRTLSVLNEERTGFSISIMKEHKDTGIFILRRI